MQRPTTCVTVPLLWPPGRKNRMFYREEKDTAGGEKMLDFLTKCLKICDIMDCKRAEHKIKGIRRKVYRLHGHMQVFYHSTMCFVSRNLQHPCGEIYTDNFVRTMLRLGAEKKEITVVDDQIGSPTYTADLAVLLCDMIQTEKYGVYHATNEGYCSWAEFAQAIMDKAGLRCKVRPVPTSEYPTAAKRPYNSRMSKRSLDEAGFRRLPTWQDALERYIDILQEED